MTQQHDKGFRSIFSNPQFFAELLQSCINEPWTAAVKPEDLEPVKTTFILPDFEKREADIIYKLKRPYPQEEVYCYCLMELQSTVDFFMPVRLLVYMVCLWMDLLKGIAPEVRSRQDFRLPVIIPLVLYNGVERWTVPLEFGALYEDIGVLPEYLIRFKYHLIDVNRYTEAALRELKNLVGAVFYVDQKGEMNHKIAGMGAYLEPLDYQELLTLLQWVSVIVKARQPEVGLGLAALIEKYVMLLAGDKRRDLKMFVSNFAEAVGVFLREEHETKTRLRIIEREKVQAEREKVQAEREKVQAERGLRQLVLAMKRRGVPTEEIARDAGLSQEEIEGMV